MKCFLKVLYMSQAGAGERLRRNDEQIKAVFDYYKEELKSLSVLVNE